jgi:hypothetical protein
MTLIRLHCTSFALKSFSYFALQAPYWTEISDGAKDLIRGLLNVNVSKRLTPKQVQLYSLVRASESGWEEGYDLCAKRHCA